MCAISRIVDVARLDQLDSPAQLLEPRGDEVGELAEPFDVAGAGFDRDQLLQRLE
jgi:hypothetical protein